MPAAAGAQSTSSSTGIPSDNYWLADAQGAVWNFGNAGAFGSAAGLPLNHPIVSITATKDQQGYWLVASDGGIFSYGDATFYGSTGSIALNKPIVGLDADARRQGLLDGGVRRRHLLLRRRHLLRFHRFHRAEQAHRRHDGHARRQGLLAGGLRWRHLQLSVTPPSTVRPVPSTWRSPSWAWRPRRTARATGWWPSDGGIFNFGDATFAGSAAGGPGLDPAERVVSTASGHGYWVEEQNGTAYPFGDAVGAPPTEALMFAPATPGDKAVLFAFAQLGKPYIWGGNGPVGYDCSGLALAAWESVGVGFARVSDDQYHTAGQPVALNSLSAGDLVFWGTSQTDWTTVYHTAIYVGGDQIVEATGDHVQLNSLGQWGTGDLMPNGRRP